MPEAYRITEQDQAHFVTCTFTDWIDLFTRPAFADIVLDSLAFCIKHKGLHLHAWCLMPNHLHLIASGSNEIFLASILRDFKRHTAKAIDRQLAQNTTVESRRNWILKAFRLAGQLNSDNERTQVWQAGYHPVLLADRDRAEQRLHYLHENPVRAGLVYEPWEYRYSSAREYATGKAGLLPLELLL